MSKHFFYIARCSDNTLYSGYCIDINAREQKHNKGDGSKYTRARRPVKIVYFEEYKSRSEAMVREAQVKKWKRDKKEVLVAG